MNFDQNVYRTAVSFCQGYSSNLFVNKLQAKKFTVQSSSKTNKNKYNN